MPISPPALAAIAQVPPFAPHAAADVTGLGIVATTFLLLPFAVALAVRMLRRNAPPALPPQWHDQSARLERLEQAVDTIAVEVERISEGQRFLTKLLAGRPDSSANEHAALEAGEASARPIPAAEQDRA
jgi:hypothetical protein